MQCLKCGRNVDSGDVFCEICREEMEQYPVKPGTVVLLPHYIQHSTPPKRVQKRIVPQEEQIRRLKKRNRSMAFLLALAVACAISFGMAALYLYAEYEDKYLPGQNYSVVESEKKTTVTTNGSGE